MVALDYFRRLGRDTHHRLFQVYGREEKKTKTAWGGNSVDHEKLAETHIRAMTAAELNRFMVMCSLVPDLFCPGYSSAETLSKEANLMRTAGAMKSMTRKSRQGSPPSCRRREKTARCNRAIGGKEAKGKLK